MQITITGPRGGGATTLAIAIGRFLRDKGMDVAFKSRDHKAEQLRRDEMSQPVADDQEWLRSSVVIVEGIEDEDEYAVSRRAR